MKRIVVHPEHIEDAIKEAVAVLHAGGLVVYPTETTYGIGADCENPQAIAKLLAYKGKRDGKALSVAVGSKEMAKRYVRLNDTASSVYEKFLPGPVTVISQSTGIVAPGIESENHTLGIRIPNYPLALRLLTAFGRGITATGANASYKKRPYTIDDILTNTSSKQQELLDLLLDVGKLAQNEPSTVIDTTYDDVSVLRAGKVHFGNRQEKVTHSVEETLCVAEKLMQEYRSYHTYTPIIIALSGSLGAGKTHFVKGIAQGLNIKDPITSPTYTYAHEYTYICEGREGIFTHIDAWRMKTVTELLDIGFDSMIAHHHIVCIEWADRFAKTIDSYQNRAKIIWVALEQGDRETDRVISIVEK